MTRTIYQNNLNADKYLEVIRYGCGHYHIVQFMRWGSIVNKIGSRTGRRCRWTKRNLQELLQDYHRTEAFEIRLVHKGRIWQHEAA